MGETTLLTPAALREWPLPDAGASKHSRGHVLIAGGSPSTPGAAMLAGVAALRVGAGVLALAVARSIAPHVAVAVPEAAVHGLSSLDAGDGNAEHDQADIGKALSGNDTLCIGPGIDTPDAADALLRGMLSECEQHVRLVIDAFALGVLPGIDDVSTLAGRTVLTPNGAEASRLLNTDKDEISARDPAQVAADIAARFQAVVSFEGQVADPDGRAWKVESGHAGLGTSGSGDVLAGAVAGLLARGAEPAQAACWATYLHATAGDRLAPRVGRLGFLAREVVDELPLVLVQAEA